MVDYEAAKQAVKALLEAIGEDVDREGLRDTPDRVARMYAELTLGMDEDAGKHLQVTFNSDSDGLVLEKDITFYSTCEHHLMPFMGKAHIAYLPSGKVAGLSKLARTVEVYARRLQIQEQLTSQIADAVDNYLLPRGVMVVMEAEHTCMTARGIKKAGSKTLTYACRGEFVDNAQLRSDVFALIKG
ncbi:MAG: GTP cyclohydrolase I FolE [Clostridia bacterium]|nr:GTP cyclohydrolase I FolE [Clostridia bacterium]